ncbi:MAG: TetR/AcrR family transcriptional regulator [Lachnospiraceae bacterium]
MDLRVEKTERGIKNAFIELRSKKPLEKITIKELCELACINKSTFYSHYKDIYDLSDSLEEEVVRSITNSISHPEYIKENPAEFTKELFLAYLSQNSLTMILFSGSRRNHLIDRIETSIKEMVFKEYPEYREDAVWNIILGYCIQGGYHTFQRNREGDMTTLISVIGEITKAVQELYGTL